MRAVSTISIFLILLGSVGVTAAPKDNKVKKLQAEICVGGVVDKDKLLVHLLRSYPGTAEAFVLYPVKNHSGSGIPLIRQLVSDKNACYPESDDCGERANAAMTVIRTAFQSFVNEGEREKTFIGLGQATMSRYFSGSSRNLVLQCIPPKAESKRPDGGEGTANGQPSGNQNKKDEEEQPVDKIRLRGDVADLIYDRRTEEFKGASAAKFNLTDDRSSGKKITTKVKAVVGYAYSLVDKINLSQQIIPFVSVNQTITDQNGQRKLNDSNYFAGGTVFNWFYAPSNLLGHNISTTPQFLYNTADRSQIANFRLDYKPYLNGDPDSAIPLTLNWATLSSNGKIRLTWIFGLRSDVGYYVRKGDISDPNLHTSFARVGGQFGFVLKLVDYRLTLKASEWLMYGYAGNKRELDLFDSSITYSLDPKDYFGIEFSYKRGRDLDTTDPIQQWTLAFTAKY
jgi:hypothetical protein